MVETALFAFRTLGGVDKIQNLIVNWNEDENVCNGRMCCTVGEVVSTQINLNTFGV